MNNQRALRIEPNSASAPNIIAGFTGNAVAAGVRGATISGGGAASYLGTSTTNRVNADFGTIGGGSINTVQSGGIQATIGGGWGNTIQALRATIAGGHTNTIQTGANYATIAGGNFNSIKAQLAAIGGGGGNEILDGAGQSTIGGGGGNVIHTNAYDATIGGGNNNSIEPNASTGTIGGGSGNTIQATANHATIGGGWLNTIGTNADNATIVGGQLNTIQFQATSAIIGGGGGNLVLSNGAFATIPGGLSNTATNYAFAAGHRAKAVHTGTFVWADSTDADFSSTTTSQFNVRATSGVRVSDNTPGLFFGETTRQMLNLWSTNFALGVQDNTTYFRSSGHFSWFFGGSHNNAENTPGAGGSVGMTLTASGLTVNGTFVSASDRNVKADFRPVNPTQVLDKVLALPLQEWIYQADPKRSRHLGPMAQDFHAAFGLGQDDTSIATVDADGVALAAIQGLNAKVESGKQKAESRIEKLEAENAELKARLENLEQLFKQQNGGAQ